VNPRQSLTDAELQRLLEVATPDRRLIYEILEGTGFRRSEVASLEVQDFNEKDRTLTLSAGNAKNRTRTIQPISARLTGL